MYSTRATLLSDLKTIVQQRQNMFLEMNDLPKAQMPEQFMLKWLEQHMLEGKYFGQFAILDGSPEGSLEGKGVGEIVGGAGLMVYHWLPSTDLTTLRGYICNVYVQPAHRGKGLAKQMVQHLLELCTLQGIRLVMLHASEMGRPIYEKMGFEVSPEMIWKAL